MGCESVWIEHFELNDEIFILVRVPEETGQALPAPQVNLLRMSSLIILFEDQ